jgi:hypothetical protein
MVSISKRLKRLFDEIDVYRQHGLFRESLTRCRDVSRLISTLEKPSARKNLSGILTARVKSIRSEADGWIDSPGPFRMNREDQTLVRALFSGPGGPAGSKAAEKTFRAAEALFVFGQHDVAIAEFDKLLDEGRYRIQGAKGIAMSLYLSSGFGNAVSQYRRWLTDPRFSTVELNQLQSFMERIVNLKGLETAIPPVPGPAGATDGPNDEDSLEIEVLSVSFPSANENADRDQLRFPVSFQEGNRISIDIPAQYQNLLQKLKPGSTFKEMVLNAKAVFFRDDGLVTEQIPLTKGGGAVRVTIRSLGI